MDISVGVSGSTAYLKYIWGTEFSREELTRIFRGSGAVGEIEISDIAEEEAPHLIQIPIIFPTPRRLGEPESLAGCMLLNQTTGKVDYSRSTELRSIHLSIAGAKMAYGPGGTVTSIVLQMYMAHVDTSDRDGAITLDDFRAALEDIAMALSSEKWRLAG